MNKKAQTGETISWIVATIIIFVVLMFFVLGASLLGGTKKISQYAEHAFDNSGDYNFDSYHQKSIYSYFISDDSTTKVKIKNYLEEEGYPFEEKQKEIRRLLN
jgi:hypothetical protein